MRPAFAGPLICSVAVSITLLAGPAARAAADSGTTDTVSVGDLQARAAEIASQVDADNRALDQLDSDYLAASIRLNQLQQQEQAGRQRIAAALSEVGKARTELKQEALLSYVAGGVPEPNFETLRPETDPSLVISYASITANGEQRALEGYRASLDAQAAATSQLTNTLAQAQATLTAITRARAQANDVLADRQSALSQVNGQLAVAVQAAQAARQQSEQKVVQAEFTSRDQAMQVGAAQRVAGQVTAGQQTTPTTQAQPHLPPATLPATLPPATLPPATRPPQTTAPAPSPPPTSPPTTAPVPAGGPGPQAGGASRALAYARAQLGKPYQWAAAGPNSFDCSGLVMMAWQQAGIFFPHLAQDQYDMTQREPLSDALPGDLIFFGTPSDVYHVGIYIGNGQMIDAPETGQDVSIQSIYWDSLLGAGRVTASS